MSPLNKLIHSLLAVFLMLSIAGFAAQPALAGADAQVTCTQYHTVKRGESLYRIGLLYGVNWRDLAKANNLANARLIYTGQKLCVDWTGSTPTTPPPSNAIPTFKIASVVKDKNVTIQTANFPANDTFKVMMGAFGTQGVGGIRVDTINTGNGGTLNATFNIPASLQGSDRIAIRLSSPTSGYFSYNWFWNSTTGSGTGTGDPGTGTGYSGIPTFSIATVAKDNSVTIRTNNFPANDKFDVLMNVMGTKGVNGVKVETINSGQGGAFTATFKIPASLLGQNQIAIRLQSPTSGYFAYNWFYNR